MPNVVDSHLGVLASVTVRENDPGAQLLVYITFSFTGQSSDAN